MTSEAAISSTSFISWGLSSASSLDDFDARVGALLRTVRALSARPIAGQSSGDGGDGDGAGYRRRGRSTRPHRREDKRQRGADGDQDPHEDTGNDRGHGSDGRRRVRQVVPP